MTTNTLAERLRAWGDVLYSMGKREMASDVWEAADALDARDAEIARLRKALVEVRGLLRK